MTQQHSQQLGCLHDSFVLLAVGLELRAHPASQFQQALAVGDQPREEGLPAALIVPIHSLAAPSTSLGTGLDGRLAVAGEALPLQPCLKLDSVSLRQCPCQLADALRDQVVGIGYRSPPQDVRGVQRAARSFFALDAYPICLA